MTRPVVALDLDDLIFPFCELLVPFGNEHLDVSLTMEDIHTFNFEDVWGGSRNDAIGLVHKFFDQLEAHPEPISGAMQGVDKLADHFTLAIVTSRDDSLHDYTLEWVETHFPATFVEVHLCNSYMLDDRPTKRRKVDVCEEMGAVALVDDSLENVAAAAERGMKGLLFGQYTWNRAGTLPPGVTRVTDWDGVVDQLLEEA